MLRVLSLLHVLQVTEVTMEVMKVSSLYGQRGLTSTDLQASPTKKGQGVRISRV